MGWLKDLCELHEAGSLEEVAKRLLDDGYTGERKKRPISNPRSLANTLRDVDAGTRALTAGLEEALARALDIDVAELRDAQTEGGGETVPQDGKLRVPGTLITLDPAVEPLPPGYPNRALDPRRWDRDWWHARDMLEPEMGFVADWIAARHRGVKVVKVATLGESLAQLPERGAAMVLVETLQGDELQLADELPRQLAVMVVARRPLTEDGRKLAEELAWNDKAEGGATIVRGKREMPWREVPPEAPDVVAVVEWFRGRVEPGGGFDAVDARDLLGQSRFGRACATPGRMLEVCQAVDDFGAKRIGRWTGLKLLEHVLKKRAEEGPVRLLGRRPWTVIERLIARLATRPQGLEAAFDDELLADLVEPPDPDRIRLIAGDATLSDVEARAQLRRVLGPEASRVGDSLVLLGWVRRFGSDSWQVRDHWLLGEVLTDTIDAWITEADEALGYAMLAHDVAPTVVGRLYQRFAEGDVRILSGAMGGLEDMAPTSVALSEGCLRAAGLAAVCSENLTWSDELRAASTALVAFRQQHASGVEGPLVEWKAPATGWLSPAALQMAALGVEWVLFPGSVATSQLGAAVDNALRELRDPPDLAHRLFRFVERALLDAGAPDASEAVKLVRGIIDAAASDAPCPWGIHDVLTAVGRLPAIWENIETRAAERGIEMDRVYRSIWAGEDSPDLSAAPGTFHSGRRNAWSGVPRAVVSSLIGATPIARGAEMLDLFSFSAAAVSLFPPSIWPMIMARSLEQGGACFSDFDGDDADLLAHLPVESVGPVISSGAFRWRSSKISKMGKVGRYAVAMARGLWSRFDEEVAEAIWSLEDLAAAHYLIATAPPEFQARLFPRMVSLAAAQGPTQAYATVWATRWMLERVPGWEGAWRTLKLKEMPKDAAAG